MSVRVSSWVWRHSGAVGNDLLLLLALADVADDSGRCWPSVAYLVEKTKLSRATVQRRLHALTEAGRIVTSSRSGAPNVYEFVLDMPLDATSQVPQPEAGGVPQVDTGSNLTPVALDDTGGASPSATGGASLGEALHVIDTSVTRHSPRKRATTLPDDFTVTADMRAWAAEKAPGVDLDWQTEQFRDHHQGKGSRFVDWRKAWQTWIRNAAKWDRGRKPQPREDRYIDQIPEAWR